MTAFGFVVAGLLTLLVSTWTYLLVRRRNRGFAFELRKHHRLGAWSSCDACWAGSLIGLGWPDAQQNPDPEIAGLIRALKFHRRLRVGALYQCSKCGWLWHLNGSEEWMTPVAPGREALVEQWDAAPVTMSAHFSRTLQEIGANGATFRGTGTFSEDIPCSVTTKSGQRIDCALVTYQADAPVEYGRNYRLASDLREIRQSPFALPKEIRCASNGAHEIAMGFAPTLIELPDGEEFTLNGNSYFLVGSRSPAEDARLCNRQIDRMNLPPIANEPEDLIYFVADPEI